jgi:hypothetical protein
MNPFSWIKSGLRSRLSAHRQAPREIRLRVLNLTRDTELANRMEVAGTGGKRSKGLLGRQRLCPGEGLWIIPCEAVHTFWMRFPIDLVYLDGKKRISKLVSEVPPWRFSACFWASSVMELPAGTIRETHTESEDTLEFSEVSLTGENAGAPEA